MSYARLSPGRPDRVLYGRQNLAQLSHPRKARRGQGAVYKATDTKLGRTVVIKVLPAELTVKEANLKRFEREARLASTLDHPNICSIYDLDEVDGMHFIAMQYVGGKNVRQLVKGRPLELKSALLIGIQVCDALAAAHARGIIHRDIKSGNVMVTDSGQVKVLDFGLAKLLDEEVAQREGIHQTQLTEVGVPYGTPTHAAPEQARGDRVDHRADIFSTGVLLYEMLAGIWPFQGKTSIDVRHAVLHDQPKPLAEMRTDHIPARLQQILDKARPLSKDNGDARRTPQIIAGSLRLRRVHRICQAVCAASSLRRRSNRTRHALVSHHHGFERNDGFRQQPACFNLSAHFAGY